MDKQDKRDERDKARGALLHSELTETIIGCAFDVSNEIGAGFLESVYENSLTIALRKLALPLGSKPRLKCSFAVIR